jgi:hypothetical protein|nr:MAG TPA: hypothetical protein [Myoviridae sp. ctfA14]
MKLLNLEEYLTPESIKVHDINQWDSFLFNLLEEENIYPPKLTGQWITDKNRFYEKFVCLKEVTENTYYPMYCRQYNPIEITIYHEKNGLYDFKCMLISIDDTAFGFGWENLERLSIDKYVLEIISWIDKVDKLDHEELIKYGLSLGAEDLSW